MTMFLAAKDVSTAWLAAVEYLNALPNRSASNLVVAIDDPTREYPAVRQSVDRYIDNRRKERRSIQRISTVANTIFPISLYRPQMQDMARAHLYTMEELGRPLSKRRNRGRSNYFERMVNYPSTLGPVNQLERSVLRLRSMRDRGNRNAQAFEIGLLAPGEDGAVDGVHPDVANALAIYAPGLDNSEIGFPCLSHVSVTLAEGRLNLAALYRNHDFLGRAYGNYLGLGRIAHFLAQESGWAIGELVCVSSHAAVEVGLGRGFGRQAVAALITQCREAVADVA